jgi:hypothetical protein
MPIDIEKPPRDNSRDLNTAMKNGPRIALELLIRVCADQYVSETQRQFLVAKSCKIFLYTVERHNTWECGL